MEKYAHIFLIGRLTAIPSRDGGDTAKTVLKARF